MRRIGAVFAAAFALACVGVAAIAIAHTVRHPTTVSIHLKSQGTKPDTFEGKVTSDTTRCEANRRISLRTDLSKYPNGPTIARTTTDAGGRWSVQLTGNAAPGSYYAVAPRKVLRKNAHHLHVCKRGVSDPLSVG
jgi:hypothetical protein